MTRSHSRRDVLKTATAGAAAAVLPSGRPQRVMWADSWRYIIIRKPIAATRNTTHETPLPSRLIGTQ